MKLILASNSPRRRQLLTDLGLPYEIRLLEVEESYPEHLRRAEVAEYLAAHKAAAYVPGLAADEVVLTADTIVCLENDVLNKPADVAGATAMLTRLQGRAHDVITAVCHSGAVMPPKSTFFYPKTIGGFLFSSIADEEANNLFTEQFKAPSA